MIHYKGIYGLTGGIASGKSTVSGILIKMGYSVVDMDKISREIFERGKPAYIKVVNHFGEEILDKNEEIDRKKLGSIVFPQAEKLKILNDITHPEIMRESKNKIENILKDEDIVFVDSPLLFETIDTMKKYDLNFDKLILVYVNRETQIKRLIKRDGIEKEEAYKILNSQMDIEDKREKADYIIENTGTIEELEVKVRQLLKAL